jgi:hypothetical protein
MHLSKFAFVGSALFGHCFAMTLVHLPLGQAYFLKALTQEAKQQWTIVLLRI